MLTVIVKLTWDDARKKRKYLLDEVKWLEIKSDWMVIDQEFLKVDYALKLLGVTAAFFASQSSLFVPVFLIT